MKDTLVPKVSINGLTFFPVPKFKNADLVFGAPRESFFKSKKDLPEIPKDMEKLASSLFFEGGTVNFHEKVNKEDGMRALQSWLLSFSPSHEVKIATVGYALWLWTHPTALDNFE